MQFLCLFEALVLRFKQKYLGLQTCRNFWAFFLKSQLLGQEIYQL